MKIVEQSYLIMVIPENILETLEKIGRTCYQSEGNIEPGSAEKFCKMILKKNHQSVLEHVSITIKFITNRGVTHELVRHRLAAFSQESTRYVKYDGKMEFIQPVWSNEWSDVEYDAWHLAMALAETEYQSLLTNGSRPEQAREVLPNSLKTEIVVTANLREWRHIFDMRCSKAAHPQMRALMIPLLKELQSLVPVIFDDIDYDGKITE